MAELRLGKKTEINMTDGSIVRHIAVFALPLLLGNLFQQLYNMVDTWVVGNFVGKVSFSAVGTIGPVCNTLIGFFTGFSSGAGVVISQKFGAGDRDGVEKSVHTYVSLTLILCVAFTLIGVLGVPVMLSILKSPAEVAEQQRIYLTIYFAGVSGLLIYNMGSAILQAIGNSTLPFIFLAISTVINIGLDLLLVIHFGMGTAGVAFATIISQAVSAVLVVIVLLNTKSQVRVSLRKLTLNLQIIGNILRIGLPAAIQMSITAFSNVFVQSYINFFGTDVMAGWTAYGKIDQIVFLAMQSISVAVTTFIGQNIGAGKLKRARKGAYCALLMALGATGAAVAFIVGFAPGIVSFFVDADESQVIYYGVLFLRMNLPLQLTACVNQVFNGSLRGCGRAELPMIIMLSSFVLLRQIYLFVVSHYISNTPTMIAFSYPFGWIVCSILMFAAFIKFFPKEGKKD